MASAGGGCKMLVSLCFSQNEEMVFQVSLEYDNLQLDEIIPVLIPVLIPVSSLQLEKIISVINNTYV